MSNETQETIICAYCHQTCFGVKISDCNDATTLFKGADFWAKVGFGLGCDSNLIANLGIKTTGVDALWIRIVSSSGTTLKSKSRRRCAGHWSSGGLGVFLPS